MEINKQENTLVILEKKFNYEEALDTLAKVDSKFWVNLFLEVGIVIPRSINVQALTLALNKKIIDAKNLGLTDELLYRLRSYPYFTEYQLQQFFNVVFDDELFTSYRRYFGNLILQNYQLLSMPEEILLKALNYNQDIKESFDDFEKNIFSVSYDFNGFFDGEELDSIKEHLVKGATTNEIRDLGQKYGFNIPKRLKKEELQTILIEELGANGSLTPELEAKIKSSPAISLQRIAKTNGIKISIDLKKDELVYLLLRELERSNYETKEFLYLNLYLGDDFVFNLSYVTNEKEETEEVVEQVVEEPVVEVVEEIIPEVVEEVKEPEIVLPAKVDEPIQVLNEDETPVVPATQGSVNATINIDTNELIAALGQTIKETVSEITKQILPIVNTKCDPIINVYNQLKAEDLKDEETLEENLYEFENFSDQLNPYYDSEIAKTMNYADKKQIEPQYELEEELPVEEEIDLTEDEELSEENGEEVLDKKEAKKAKKALRKEKKVLKKEAKLEKKQAKKETKAEEKKSLKEQKQKDLEKALEEKNQAKIDSKLAKKQLKEDKKQAKKDTKNKIKQNELNRKNMEKALRTGVLTDDIDDAYFEKQMRLREYRNMINNDQKQERRYKRRRRAKVFKAIFAIILLLAIVYFAIAVSLAYNNPTFSWLNDPINNTIFFNGFTYYDILFSEPVKWLRTFLPNCPH